MGVGYKINYNQLDKSLEEFEKKVDRILERLDGLSFKKTTLEAYNALPVKDEMTIYLCEDPERKKLKMFRGTVKI